MKLKKTQPIKCDDLHSLLKLVAVILYLGMTWEYRVLTVHAMHNDSDTITWLCQCISWVSGLAWNHPIWCWVMLCRNVRYLGQVPMYIPKAVLRDIRSDFTKHGHQCCRRHRLGSCSCQRPSGLYSIESGGSTRRAVISARGRWGAWSLTVRDHGTPPKTCKLAGLLYPILYLV